MIRIGLPKGVVIEKSIAVVRYLMDSNVNKNRLNFRNDFYNIFLLKHRDIPKMVEDGLLDIGITAFEWIEENSNNVKILNQLEWCNTSICLIVAKEKEEKKFRKMRCITEFPNIAKKYFDEKNIESEIYHITGSSEACIHDVFDCCIDCVETGGTLRENNLIVKDIIFHSKIVLIAKNNINIDAKYIEKVKEAVLSVE